MDAEAERQVQIYVNFLNQAYAKACVTSDAYDWHTAALVGRQLACRLSELGLAKDTFDHFHDQALREKA